MKANPLVHTIPVKSQSVSVTAPLRLRRAVQCSHSPGPLQKNFVAAVHSPRRHVAERDRLTEFFENNFFLKQLTEWLENLRHF